MKKTLLTLLLSFIAISLKAQNNNDVTITTIDSGKIFTSVEHQPEFPGGLSEFGKFLSANIVYPTIARQNKIEGRVIIQFIIETDGALSNVKVLRGVSKEINEEALRVLKISPKWQAGVQNNKPVRCTYVVPIAFSLK